MPREADPSDVQITLADGRVKHYKQTFGDSIVMTSHRDDPKPKEGGKLFYTLIIVPRDEVQKDV